MSETALVKYERPMNVPVQTVGNLRILLHSHMTALAAVRPKRAEATIEKMLSTAVDAALAAPTLMTTCTADSLFRSIKTAVELGFTFSKALPRVHLVPFKSKGGGLEAQLIIDYRGYLDLVHRATGVTVDAQVVYAGEPFKLERGTIPTLYHEQRMDVDREDKDIIAAYSVAYFKPPHFEAMTIEELKTIRATSKQPNGLMWAHHFPAACRKTVIRRHVKYLPMSGEDRALLDKALEHDDATEGLAGLELKSAAERTAALKTRIAGEPDKADDKGVVDAEHTPVEQRSEQPTDDEAPYGRDAEGKPYAM